MVSGLGAGAGAYPAALGGRSPAQDGGTKELTTVTTHCDKDHWHTPACPHTVYTRTVDEAQRRGVQFTDHMKLKKKKDQSVDTSVLLRRENKILIPVDH